MPDLEPISARGEHLVTRIRHLDPPSGRGSGEQLMVGGATARLIDAKAAIGSRLPWAIGIIVVATFVLLFLMFGSVLVPIKAIVLNVLSLSATFGAMVWVFQQGHGSGILGFTPTGLTDTTTPILMFCIAFGLSMDYEVFLLSRIKEEYDRTGDNEASVAAGLERTGRIVTAAAALLAVTFLAFATSDITFIKLFGLGLALAVLMDATLIRATLVPAFMKLAGDANWWAPAWMRRIHERFGFSESEPEPEADTERRHRRSRTRTGPGGLTGRHRAPVRRVGAPERDVRMARRAVVDRGRLATWPGRSAPIARGAFRSLRRCCGVGSPRRRSTCACGRGCARSTPVWV